MSSACASTSLHSDENEICIVPLYDGEANIIYNVPLRKEDAIRCEQDIDFATIQLNKIKNNTKENNQTINTKDTWSENEVVALINSYDFHKEHFKSAKKKKNVWNDIYNELLSNGIEKTPTKCETKWKNLLATYKNVKDLLKRTGRGPTKFKFFHQMNEILSDKPVTDCSHTYSTSPMCSQTINSSEKNLDLDDCQVTNDTNKKNIPQIIPIKSEIKEKAKAKTKNQEELIKLKLEYLKNKEKESLEKQDRKRKKEEREERLLNIKEKKIRLLEEYLNRNK